MGEAAGSSVWTCDGIDYTVNVRILRRLPLLSIATAAHGATEFRATAERVRDLIERSGQEFPRMRVSVRVDRPSTLGEAYQRGAGDDRTAARLADRTLRIALTEGKLDLAIAWTIARTVRDVRS